MIPMTNPNKPVEGPVLPAAPVRGPPVVEAVGTGSVPPVPKGPLVVVGGASVWISLLSAGKPLSEDGEAESEGAEAGDDDEFPEPESEEEVGVAERTSELEALSEEPSVELTGIKVNPGPVVDEAAGLVGVGSEGMADDVIEGSMTTGVLEPEDAELMGIGAVLVLTGA